ncbi:MAG: hypothetical protein KY440_03505 [Actinobacteria bacterium]|nr:hypothetical protein [Actinomycetota bacterium]
MSAGDLLDRLHEGWTNRETYVAHLHLTTDDGLVRTASASLHLTEIAEGAVTPEAAGRTLAGLLRRFLAELEDAGLVDEHQAICQDIGSLSRVDWTEVGAAFLDMQDAV